MTSVTTVPLTALVHAVEGLLTSEHDEHALTRAVAEQLRSCLAGGITLPASVITPNPDRYVMYPLHVDPAGRFSIASAVWNVGQGTPVHGHETWGVVGIYAGIEHELSFDKPTADGEIPTMNGETDWRAGQVTVCCTTDDDVHQVSCGGDEPCVGIHIYGADIGTLSRRSYDPVSGAVSWFTSTWTPPAATPTENT